MPTKLNPNQVNEDTLEDADGNTKVQVEEAADENKIRFDTAGTERMIIDADGKVGIGTASPTQILTLNATDPTILFREGGTDKATIGVNSADNILFENKTTNKHIVFKVNDQGTVREGLRLDGAVPEVVVNQQSDSLVDFRVESDNNTHMLFVDGSADAVGINTSTPGSGLHVAHSISLPVGALRTSAYTITATDFCIVADCNSSAFTLTLPSATDAMAGRIYTIKRMDSGNSGGGNMLTVSRNGKNIDNIAGDVVLANLDALTLQCIGASGGWIRTGGFLAPLP